MAPILQSHRSSFPGLAGGLSILVAGYSSHSIQTTSGAAARHHLDGVIVYEARGKTGAVRAAGIDCVDRAPCRGR